jgi:phospholipid/cholesterol/gamma-HCH transport system permease protein
MKERYLRIDRQGQAYRIECMGEWTLYQTDRIDRSLRTLKLPEARQCIIDFSGVRTFDSAGMLLLQELEERLKKLGCRYEVQGLDAKQRKILELLRHSDLRSPLPQRKESLFHRVGRATVAELAVAREFLAFVGELSAAFLRLFAHPGNFRFRETVYHIEKSGFDALFIIALTSILVGLVIAYQSLVQLSQFGADIYVVDAIGISITRELGPMITAIVIAGRSASSYTAEIGTMKLTEEISAMRTMGFDPFYFLVIPRIVALIVAMPLVIFFAAITGILGGMIAPKAQVDLSFAFFLERLQEVLSVRHYILGIVKGPFFALIIAATGCFHGFRVTSDTESIGIETTASVVHAIFFVIACDALFSVIFTELGW